jgi:hypothetical protein
MPTTSHTERLPSRRFTRDILDAALLMPLGIGAVGAVLAGRRRTAQRWLTGGGAQPPSEGAGRLVLGAVATVLLGLPALAADLLQVLFVFRGMLYGLVARGPYDHAWGGPTRSGVWLAHFFIGLPIALAGIGLLWLLARLHRSVVAPAGERPAWALPVTPLLGAAGIFFFVAWSRQL